MLMKLLRVGPFKQSLPQYSEGRTVQRLSVYVHQSYGRYVHAVAAKVARQHEGYELAATGSNQVLHTDEGACSVTGLCPYQAALRT